MILQLDTRKAVLILGVAQISLESTAVVTGATLIETESVPHVDAVGIDADTLLIASQVDSCRHLLVLSWPLENLGGHSETDCDEKLMLFITIFGFSYTVEADVFLITVESGI
jgi:hypothetical protein